MSEFRTHEEVVASVTSRWSVQDLVEQSDEDLAKSDELFYKSKEPIEIVDYGTENLIRWWQIKSGDNTYIVRRFKQFCWCSCPGFFYKKNCRHIAATALVQCANCHQLPAREGKYCFDCNLSINHFLRQKGPAEFERIGSGKF